MAGTADIPSESTPRAIIIMGVSGSGKSTLGAELARTLECPFLEGDGFHSSEAIGKMRSGEALTDDDRWPWLDRIAVALGKAAQTHGIAVASCSALRRIYRDRLRASLSIPALFVLLNGEWDTLWRRVTARKDHYMPASLLSSQIDTLELPGTDEEVLILDAALPLHSLRDCVIDKLRCQLPR